MTTRVAKIEKPKFCGRCGMRLLEDLVCARCGSDSRGWESWVPIVVCENGHFVRINDD